MNTLNKDYHVVHFLDEGSTYIVADWWLVKDKKGKVISSYFPPSKNKQQVRNAILDKEKITKAWSNHPVRILQSYTNLQHAFDNVDPAAYTSHLDSDDPVPVTPRRERARVPASPENSDSDDASRGGACRGIRLCIINWYSM